MNLKNSFEPEKRHLVFHFRSQFIVNILEIEVPARRTPSGKPLWASTIILFFFASLFLSAQEMWLLLSSYAQWQPD